LARDVNLRITVRICEGARIEKRRDGTALTCTRGRSGVVVFDSGVDVLALLARVVPGTD